MIYFPWEAHQIGRLKSGMNMIDNHQSPYSIHHGPEPKILLTKREEQWPKWKSFNVSRFGAIQLVHSDIFTDILATNVFIAASFPFLHLEFQAQTGRGEKSEIATFQANEDHISLLSLLTHTLEWGIVGFVLGALGPRQGSGDSVDLLEVDVGSADSWGDRS